MAHFKLRANDFDTSNITALMLRIIQSYNLVEHISLISIINPFAFPAELCVYYSLHKQIAFRSAIISD